jgi:hypothetical protein
MKLVIDYKSLIIHIGISLLIFISPMSIILIPAIAFLTIYFYLKKMHLHVVMTAFYSIVCKGESVYYIFAILFLILFLIDKNRIPLKKDRYPIIKIYNRIKIFILYTIILYIVQLIISPSPFSLPLFYLTFLSYFLLSIYIWKTSWNKNQLSRIVINIACIGVGQAFIAFFLQALPTGIGTILNSPAYGDNLMGTSNTGTTAASVMLFSIIPLFFYISENIKRIFTETRITIILIFVLCVVFLGDAKTILFATIFALITQFAIKSIIFRIIKPRKIIFIGAIFILSSYIITTDINKIITDKFPEFELYTEGNFNSKYIYYTKTFDTTTRDPISFIFGTGGGTNGSRAANALAYDKLAKAENSTKLPPIIPPKTNEFTEKHIASLYDQDYIDQLITVSAIIASPFNSICSLFLEVGIVGSFIYMSIMYYIFFTIFIKKNIFSKSLITYLFAILIVAVAFPSFEYPSMQLFVFLHLGLIYHTYENNI